MAGSTPGYGTVWPGVHQGMALYGREYTRVWHCMAGSPPGYGTVWPGVHQGMALYGRESTRVWHCMAGSTPGYGTVWPGVHQGMALYGHTVPYPGVLPAIQCHTLVYSRPYSAIPWWTPGHTVPYPGGLPAACLPIVGVLVQ